MKIIHYNSQEFKNIFYNILLLLKRVEILRLLQVYMDFSETKYTFHRSLIETPQYFMCHNL